MQILILDTTSAPFGLAVVTTLMPSTEGLLTSMIFFSEPVITTHIKQKMAELYRIYGEEFSILEERTHRNRTTVRKHQEPQRRKSLQSGSTDRTHYTSNLFDKRNLIPRPPIAENDHHNQQPHFVSHVDLGNDNRLKTLAPPLATMSPILSVGSVSTSPNSINPAPSPQSLQRRGSSSSTSSPTVTSSTVTESIGSPSSFSDNGYDEDIISEIRTIPMRRVSVSSSVYSRIRYEYERRLSDDSATSTLVNHLGLGNNLIPSTDTQGQIFVPYRSPALARATHWLLVNIDRLRGRAPGHNNNRQQGQQGQPDISDNDMSIISTNSHSPVQNNPEVIVHSPSMPSNISTLSSRSKPRH
ncbi:hypothetical protein BDC45DRAFT_48874 [Circinella umbellata]|nr:hypothetical protein BDC45DRAFT_48874 [Circinella umbellata]